MDDLIRSRIRKALAWDFWRWTIGTVVLTAILLWMWVWETKHGRFIWLTLVPLIFLAPLYRYYRATRMLTEPETGEAAWQPVTVPADAAMKAKIRRRAKVVIGIADTLLALSFVASLLYYTFKREAPEVYSQYGLHNTGYALTRALWDYEDQQWREVALFVPPVSAADLPAWGRSVQEHLGQPAAVFVRDHGQTTWAFRSRELSVSDTAFEARMAEIESKPPRHPFVDTTGAYVSRYVGISSKVDSLALLGRMFRRVGEDRVWGVLTRRSDTWISYCARLKKAELRENHDPIDPVAERTETIINAKEILRGKNWSMLPTARVFLNGNEIYRTPALDTTAVSLIDTIQGARVELYASNQDKVYQELIKTGYFPWGRLVIIVLLFGVLHACWLWIKKLTA